MNDVRGVILGPTHGRTPAAAIANKNKTEIISLMRKGMDHTAVSATQASLVTL